jgi:glycosyltransferase involved in cell wall biosynthesis
MTSVVHIIYSGTGGIANVFFSLVQADSRDEFEHQVAFYGNQDVVPEYLAKCAKLEIPTGKFKRNSRIDTNVNKVLFHWLCEKKPDVIFLHIPRALSAAVKYRKVYSDAKIVAVEHNPISAKALIDWIDSIKLQWFCDAVIYLSHDYRQTIRQSIKIFFSSKKSHVVPNGIDTQLYKPVSSENGEEPESSQRNTNIAKERPTIIIGMASRLEKSKDIDTLIKSIKLLNDEKTDFRYVLKLAGDGAMKDDLKKLREELGLEESVEFSGYLSETELIYWFHTLDIYAHATQSETMSTSVMQALSCGLPTIASDIPGMSELVGPTYGALVPTLRPELFAQRIKELSQDAELRREMSVAARTFATDKLCEKHMWSGYKNVIRSLNE